METLTRRGRPALVLATALAVLGLSATLSRLHAAGPAAGSAGGDPAAIAKIRDEGLHRSEVAAMFHTITTRFGPRLTGSPAHKAAAEWARDRLRAWGLENPRLEPFHFGRGWQLDKQTVEMTDPRYLPLVAYAEAWSSSTSGDITGTPVYVGDKSAEDIAAMASSLKGAIVLSQPMQEAFVTADRAQPTTSDDPKAGLAPPMPPTHVPGTGTPFQIAQQRFKALHDAGIGAVLRPSAGEHGTMFVLGRDQGENAVPSLIVEAEQYNLLVRMLQAHLPVKLHVNLQTRYITDDPNTYNVLADLPGTDPALKDEVVLIGAHLDSWHSATGATDNADGVAEVLEAMRILKASGLKPRRTIRAALWSGEEEGLLGSKAYVAAHLAGDAHQSERGKFDVYFNNDPGTGKIYGWFLEHDAAAAPMFDAWLAPFTDLGARKNVMGGITNTDHMSFMAAGLPGFNPVQDYEHYDTRTHHTNVDTDERVRDGDLPEAAIVMAAFAYDAATAGERVPWPSKK